MEARRIGLALGSGSARGWAHIGIIRALAERGVEPRVVAGTSVGALVGAAYASGQLGALESWVRELTRVDVWRLLDTGFRSGGVMQGSRLMRAIRDHLDDRTIENLPIPYAAVAAELNSGQEVWLREGSMLDAVRASSGMPGLVAPVWHEGRWLIDGGVVNPVPVSVCRALGARYVIAVNLNSHLRKHLELRRRPNDAASEEDAAQEDSDEPEDWTSLERWAGLLDGLIESFRTSRREEPGIFDAIATSFSIMQDRITRSRMVGDPPDVVLAPDLGHFQLLDLHRGEEAIAIGREAVEKADAEIQELKGIMV